MEHLKIELVSDCGANLLFDLIQEVCQIVLLQDQESQHVRIDTI